MTPRRRRSGPRPQGQDRAADPRRGPRRRLRGRPAFAQGERRRQVGALLVRARHAPAPDERPSPRPAGHDRRQCLGLPGAEEHGRRRTGAPEHPRPPHLGDAAALDLAVSPRPVSSLPQKLDLALVTRLRQVVAGEVATEAELRALDDEAGGWLRATGAQLRAAEDRLTNLNADPAAPLAEIATEVRRVEALSRERAEARRLIDGLERRTRELRTAWLKHHADAGSPFAPALRAPNANEARAARGHSVRSSLARAALVVFIVGRFARSRSTLAANSSASSSPTTWRLASPSAWRARRRRRDSTPNRSPEPRPLGAGDQYDSDREQGDVQPAHAASLAQRADPELPRLERLELRVAGRRGTAPRPAARRRRARAAPGGSKADPSGERSPLATRGASRIRRPRTARRDRRARQSPAPRAGSEMTFPSAYVGK